MLGIAIFHTNSAFTALIAASAAAALTLSPAGVGAQTVGAALAALSAFSTASGETAPPPWRPVGLPAGKAPMSTMAADRSVDPGRTVLRLASQASYGTLVHDLSPPRPPAAGTSLVWRWRLEQPLAQADLRTRAGDDAALKVCVLFNQDLAHLSFAERNLLRLARTVTGEALPSATLCYVWDPQLPAGTVLANAYTRRMRWMVVDGSASPLGQWRSHQRVVADDFQRAFPGESATTPPMTAILVGADADNTGGRSLAYIGDITLTP